MSRLYEIDTAGSVRAPFVYIEHDPLRTDVPGEFDMPSLLSSRPSSWFARRPWPLHLVAIESSGESIGRVLYGVCAWLVRHSQANGGLTSARRLDRVLRQTQSAPAPAIQTPAVADDAAEAAIERE